MNKNYVKLGQTVSIVVKSCDETKAKGIAGTVQAIRIENEYYGTVIGLKVKGSKPVIMLLLQLGFYHNRRGTYYLTERQIKM